ncbi:helix-turn-helix transcriptional regulator [Paraherbaspirillum soli]|uniref:Transcriptional regulator n=1 Tax=Paraherbaspirillum soli TaxID=631222 RepID=A0ABW0MAH9_9BURK
MLTENQLLLREGEKIVDALGKTLAPLVEVVLHDLTRREHAVVAISNNLSGRSVGDPATEIGLARMVDPEFPEVLQNYPNRFPDGRPAKSTSIGLKNSRGDYVAAICLNVDISMLTAVAASLSQLAQTQVSPTDIRESLVSPRLEELRVTLERFATGLNTTPRALIPAQRREAVRQLAEAGLMDLKNAQSVVADILGVARSTVYTYLPDQGAKP